MVKYTKEFFVSNKININGNDEWDIINFSSIFLKKYKADEAEKGIILSYANALDCITDSLLKQNHSNSAKIKIEIKRNSLTIPFIFLARHTVELTLKFFCKCLNIKHKPNHKLMDLWNAIMENHHESNFIQNDKIEDIRIFISALEELDNDGCHARYSKNNRGELYNPTPQYINAKNINNFIQNSLINLVNSMDKNN